MSLLTRLYANHVLANLAYALVVIGLSRRCSRRSGRPARTPGGWWCNAGLSGYTRFHGCRRLGVDSRNGGFGMLFMPQPTDSARAAGLLAKPSSKCRPAADGLVGYAANSAANPPYI